MGRKKKVYIYDLTVREVSYSDPERERLWCQAMALLLRDEEQPEAEQEADELDARLRMACGGPS